MEAGGSPGAFWDWKKCLGCVCKLTWETTKAAQHEIVNKLRLMSLSLASFSDGNILGLTTCAGEIIINFLVPALRENHCSRLVDVWSWASSEIWVENSMILQGFISVDGWVCPPTVRGFQPSWPRHSAEGDRWRERSYGAAVVASSARAIAVGPVSTWSGNFAGRLWLVTWSCRPSLEDAWYWCFTMFYLFELICLDRPPCTMGRNEACFGRGRSTVRT